jgi:8-oxo-dGTP pyrophosphatase MutT (NUDIX family)
MKQLGEIIVSQLLTGQTKETYRQAARGIVRDGEKVLMIHCAFFNDYTFPGGGVENGEDPVYALQRECSEEAGVIIKNIRPFYKIVEKREIDEETYMIHESLFYLCDIAEYCEQHLEDYEIELGYKPVWITIDEAIENNLLRMNSLTDKDYTGVLERELRILNELKGGNF